MSGRCVSGVGKVIRNAYTDDESTSIALMVDLHVKAYLFLAAVELYSATLMSPLADRFQ